MPAVHRSPVLEVACARGLEKFALAEMGTVCGLESEEARLGEVVAKASEEVATSCGKAP